MNPTNLIKEELSSLLSTEYKSSDLSKINIEIEIPTDKRRTDFVSNICFSLAKQLAKNPKSLAEEIAQKLNNNDKLKKYFIFSGIAPGFINIEVNNAYLHEIAISATEVGSKFGHNDSLAKEKWVIEHTSPNPNKAMHIGHLRNNLLGMAIYRILEANGAEVICDAVDNDRGIAIIKAMWGYLLSKNKQDKKNTDIHYWFNNKNEWFTPEEQNIKSDHFVGQCYLIGSEEFKNNSSHEKEMRNMLVDWEKKNPEVWALWQLILDYSHKGIEQTLKRLDSKWDKVWHEHEHYELGKELIKKGIEKGIFLITDEGATITNLKKYKIPDTVVLRSDGTSLYITQDLGLTKLKKDYYSADKLAWIVGPEQSMAMRQMFAVCNQLEIGEIEDFYHISYGLVSMIDEEGNKKKMSSREGGTISIDDLIDAVKKQLFSLRPNYSEDDAEGISLAAIKFMILKSGRTSDITFDINASLRFEGASGVYLLYTYARFNSLLEKGKYSKSTDVFQYTDGEKEVLRNIAYFPLVIKESVKDFSPQIIAEHLLQLCQSMNTLYGNEIFIDETNPTQTNKKMLITKACLIALENGLRVIGIRAMKRV